jgi:hypothetical protein
MDKLEFQLLSDAARDGKRLAETTDAYSLLRKLRGDPSNESKSKFRALFSRYYGINAAGLTNEWKDKYFSLLFSFGEKMPSDPHRTALSELYQLQRRKGDNSLQFSFVSKLVAIHDEQQPIFDKYVQAYFGLGPPLLMELPEVRISGFLQNLNEIRRRYEFWSTSAPFVEILQSLRRDHAGLADCHSTRICDFLVWLVGKKYSHRNTTEIV